jgi:hypothetical protein
MDIIFVDLDKIAKSEHENIKDQCFMQFFYPNLDYNPDMKYKETTDTMEFVEYKRKLQPIGNKRRNNV